MRRKHGPGAGKSFERAVKISLEAAGCIVTLSSASRGAADVVCRFNRRAFDIQCKYGTNPSLTKTEKAELIEAGRMGGTTPLAVFRTRGTSEFRWYKLSESYDAKGHKSIGLIPWQPVWEKP